MGSTPGRQLGVGASLRSRSVVAAERPTIATVLAANSGSLLTHQDLRPGRSTRLRAQETRDVLVADIAQSHGEPRRGAAGAAVRLRARVVLLAAAGMANRAIGRELGCGRGVVSKRRVRFARDPCGQGQWPVNRVAAPSVCASVRGAAPIDT